MSPFRLAAAFAALVPALAAPAAPVAAAPQQLVFAGMFVVTTATESCQSLVGSSRNMFYSTVVYGTNRASILVTDVYQTVALSPATASFAASGELTATQIDRWNGVSTWSGRYAGFKFKPAKVKANTDSVTITGRITGFNHDPSCTIGFRAVGVRS